MARNEFIKMVAEYYVENNSTVRKTGKEFGISKTTVHNYLTKKLCYIDKFLFLQVKSIINKNKNERTLRGGLATKEMFKRMKEHE